MTKYYISYIDYTGYKGGPTTWKVIEIERRDINEARLFVIHRFLDDWIKKKRYIYKPKTITGFVIGTKKPNVRTSHLNGTGDIYFLDYPDEFVVVYQAGHGQYEVNIQNGKLITQTKVRW